MKLNSKQRRALRNRANSQAAFGDAPPPNATWWVQPKGGSGESAGCTPSNDGASAGRSAQSAQSFDDEACGVCEDSPSAASAVPPSYAEAWASEGLSSPPPRQICGYFDPSFASGLHADLWRECSVVVGMHPDQATEPLVTLALAHGKPYAVVPVCAAP